MIDFSPFNRKEMTLHEIAIAQKVTREDLIAMTNEVADLQREMLSTATDADILFVPDDPEANDPGAGEATNVGWTFAHVLVHMTASGEEGAARSLSLARGVPINERSRYETPWETIQTVAQCVQRVEESRRMRLTMLSAWPDQPLYDVTVERPHFGTLNAISIYLIGVFHDDMHIPQLRRTLEQAQAARAVMP